MQITALAHAFWTLGDTSCKFRPVQGKMFLVIVVAFTKWPKVYNMPNLRNNPRVVCFVKLFRSPRDLVTYNFSQLISDSFKYFRSISGITHLRSLPYHPQSNGQPESFVDSFKQALLKGGEGGKIRQVITKFLTAYITTPNPTIPGEKYPVEVMFG